MKAAYRDVLKHSAVYGLGQILSRVASFLLLPLYTSYLRPADYGCLALLDLTATLLGTVIGAGMASTATRYHFEPQTERGRDEVWWTSLMILAATALAIVLPAFAARDLLARLSLGAAQTQGAFYFCFLLPNICFATATEFLLQYLRVRKWSVLTVVLTLGDLLLRIGLNVWFLVAMRVGLVGILWGNLITSGVTSGVLLAIFVRSRGPIAFSGPLTAKLFRFGAPLVVTALLSTLMHQANRYILNQFADLDRVGIYSIAQAFGQGITGIILAPFMAIWAVVVYDIAAYPDAKHVYTAIFKYYVYLMGLVLFGVALFARPILALMAAADYSDAADLVPPICLGYLLFSLHPHFNVPALLAKKTVHLLPAGALAAAFSIGCNLLLVPVWGPYGAAWACVGTFAVYSFTGLAVYRRIDRYDYPLMRCGLVVAGMAGCCFLMRQLGRAEFSPVMLAACAGLVWTAWAAALFGRLAQRGYQAWRARSLPAEEPALAEQGVATVSP